MNKRLKIAAMLAAGAMAKKGHRSFDPEDYLDEADDLISAELETRPVHKDEPNLFTSTGDNK